LATTNLISPKELTSRTQKGEEIQV